MERIGLNSKKVCRQCWYKFNFQRLLLSVHFQSQETQNKVCKEKGIQKRGIFKWTMSKWQYRIVCFHEQIQAVTKKISPLLIFPSSTLERHFHFYMKEARDHPLIFGISFFVCYYPKMASHTFKKMFVD